MLTRDQRETLLRPINPRRVLVAQGQSHLPAYDVVAHLTRIFGFEGWDKELINLWLISEMDREHPEREGKTQWTVTYGCTMRLTIYDSVMRYEPGMRTPYRTRLKVIEEGATGSANNLPSRGDAHDFAMKNAMSYAIKRCAKDLGDQFGLSLYNRGMVTGVIRTVVPYNLGEDAEVPIPKTMGNDELETDDRTEN